MNLFTQIYDDIYKETYLVLKPKTGTETETSMLFGYGEKILNRLGITFYNDPFLCYFMTYVEENRPPPEYNLDWNEILTKNQINPKLKNIFTKVTSNEYINMKLNIDPISARIDRHRTLATLKAQMEMAIEDMKDRQKIIDHLEQDAEHNKDEIKKLIEIQKNTEKYAISRKLSLDEMLLLPKANREQITRSILIPQRKKIVNEWITHLQEEKDYENQPAFQVYTMYNLLEMSKYTSSDNKDNIEIQPLILDKVTLKELFEKIVDIGKKSKPSEQSKTTVSSEEIEQMKKDLEYAKEHQKELKQNKDTSADKLNAAFQRVKELNIQIQKSGATVKKDKIYIPPLNFISTYKELYIKHHFAKDLDKQTLTGWIRIPQLDKTDNKQTQTKNTIKINNLAMLSSTRWCLATPSTAAEYLEKGDVYIYYKDKMSRIVITFNHGTIDEINGLGDAQTIQTKDDEQVKNDFILKQGFEGQEVAARKLENRNRERKQIEDIVNKINNGEWMTNPPTPEDWAFFTYSDTKDLMKYTKLDELHPIHRQYISAMGPASHSINLQTRAKQYHNAGIILQQVDITKIPNQLFKFLDDANPIDVASWVDYDIKKIPPNILAKIEANSTFTNKFAMEVDNDITKLTTPMRNHLQQSDDPLINASKYNNDISRIPPKILRQIESNLIYTWHFITTVGFNLNKLTPKMIKIIASNPQTADAAIGELLQQGKTENEIPIELRRGSRRTREEYGWSAPAPNIQENMFYKIYELVE